MPFVSFWYKFDINIYPLLSCHSSQFHLIICRRLHISKLLYLTCSYIRLIEMFLQAFNYFEEVLFASSNARYVIWEVNMRKCDKYCNKVFPEICDEKYIFIFTNVIFCTLQSTKEYLNYLNINVSYKVNFTKVRNLKTWFFLLFNCFYINCMFYYVKIITLTYLFF